MYCMNISFLVQQVERISLLSWPGCSRSFISCAHGLFLSMSTPYLTFSSLTSIEPYVVIDLNLLSQPCASYVSCLGPFTRIHLQPVSFNPASYSSKLNFLYFQRVLAIEKQIYSSVIKIHTTILNDIGNIICKMCEEQRAQMEPCGTPLTTSHYADLLHPPYTTLCCISIK